MAENDFGVIGEAGPAVYAVQAFLKDLNLYSGPIDGNINLMTVDGIRIYQERMGITPTTYGVWDAATEEATNYFTHYVTQGTRWWSSKSGGRVTFDPKTTIPDLASPKPPTGETPTVDTPTPTPDDTPNPQPPDLRDAFAEADRFFRSVGLPALIEPAKQALRDGMTFDQFKSVLYSPDTSNPTYLQAHEAFKARFPAIFSRENGFQTLTPEIYMTLEDTYREIFRNSLLPASLFDSPEDFTRLIESDVSPTELQQRIEQGFDRVQQAAPEVRQAFADYFGVAGDSALAAMFLDPTPGTTDRLLRMVEEAAIGGAGTSYGVAVTRELASRLASVGVEEMQARRGFKQISQISTLFQENLGDTADMTAEREGVATVFDAGDPEAARALEARRAGRVNTMQGGGAALITDQGVRGFGTSS